MMLQNGESGWLGGGVESTGLLFPGEVLPPITITSIH